MAAISLTPGMLTILDALAHGAWHLSEALLQRLSRQSEITFSDMSALFDRYLIEALNLGPRSGETVLRITPAGSVLLAMAAAH